MILGKKERGEYLVKDVFCHKEIIISMTGKERMLYKYEKGNVVNFAESTLRPEKVN